MKILALRLSNLASIAGEYEINFEATPLAQAGLIAITGKTGAGKSTLLDAMCLALYDQIPRLTGAVGSLVDASGQGISIKDSKHILRRGCTQGFAEVEFLALDQKRYVARWDIKRARNKLDGNLKIDRAIKRLEDGRVLTQKISECSPLVQQLIGLSFEQFTRAVLLAQSEVGAFLKAKDQDRADLLEYLTNSGIFSIISQLSFAKTKHFKDELEQLQRVVGHIELLSDEQVTEIQQQKTELTAQIELLRHTQKQREQQQLWYAQQLNLQQQIDAQQQQLDALKAQDQYIFEQQQLLQQLEQFADIKNTWLTLDKTQQVQQQQQQLLQQLSSVLAEQQNDFQAQQQLVAAAEQQLKQHKTEHLALAPILEHAQQLDSSRSHLQAQYVTKSQEVDAAQQLLKAQQHDLQQLQQQQQAQQQQFNQTELLLQQSQDLAEIALEPKASLGKIAHFLAQAADLKKQLQQQFAQQRDALPSTANNTASEQMQPNFDVTQLAQVQQTLTQQIEAHQASHGSIETLEAQIEHRQQRLLQLQQQQQAAQTFARSLAHLNEIEQQQQLTTQGIAQLQPELQQLETQQLQAQQRLQHNEQQLSQLQQMLAEQRILQSEHVAGLRAQLQPAQACMVCGSTEHPYVQHAELLNNAMQQIQTEQMQNAITARNDAQLQLDAAKSAVIAAQTQLRNLQQQQTQLQQQGDAAQQQLQHDYALTGFDFGLEHAQLAHETETSCSQLKQLLDDVGQQLHASQNALKHSKALRLQQQQQQQISEALAQYQQAEAAILQQLNADWTAQWQQQPVATAHHLVQQIEQRVAAQQQLLTQQDGLQRINTAVQTLSEKCAWQQQQLDALQAQQQHITNNGKRIKQELMTLIQQHSPVAYASARDWQAALLQKQTQLEQALDVQQTLLHQLDQHFQQQKTEWAALNSQVNMRQQQLIELLEAQQHWLQQHPEFNDAMVSRCLNTPPHEKQALAQQIQQFMQQRHDAETQLRLYSQQQQQHQHAKPELSELDVQQHLTQLNDSITDLSQQRDALNASLLSHEQSLSKVAIFQAQIEQLQGEVNRWGKISELIGSKEGTKFQRIAQEHHLDILIEYANLQLQPLAPRYVLQRIPDSLSFAIIDLDMNSEIRPVLSLSGGETFLVSLALALAIANMASNNTKLESLFIDEGFGTLDPSSLHTVMDALDRLQSQGRKVVLISHVQEMHERIPVQIQVQSIGAGASKICIVG